MYFEALKTLKEQRKRVQQLQQEAMVKAAQMLEEALETNKMEAEDSLIDPLELAAICRLADSNLEMQEKLIELEIQTTGDSFFDDRRSIWKNWILHLRGEGLKTDG